MSTLRNRQEIEKAEHNERYSAKQVIIQDQTTEVIDLYLCKLNGTTNPSLNVAMDSKIITVNNTTGAVIGDCINIRENGHYFQSLITAIVGNNISFASPTDMVFTTAASVCFGEWNLATANGAVTPVEFFICPPTGVEYDIYGISFSFEDNAIMYEGTFGGIPQLTNGIVLRITDSYTKNLLLVSNNAGFREYGFKTEYPDKVPSGTYAFWADKSLIQNNGVAVRLNGANGDTIKVIVQDNLTGLIKLAVTVHGHLVD